MQIRFQNSPKEVKGMSTAELRENFLVQSLMQADHLELVYSHYDRVIVGGVKPVNTTVPLKVEEELKANYFLERRELGIINVGGDGTVVADGVSYELSKLDCLYLGKGTQEVSFSSKNAASPADFFLMSTPAHASYPNTLMTKEAAVPVAMGETATANKRTIYKYIHLDGIKSCQLVMGLTVLAEGSVWNSVPPHTHTQNGSLFLF